MSGQNHEAPGDGSSPINSESKKTFNWLNLGESNRSVLARLVLVALLLSSFFFLESAPAAFAGLIVAAAVCWLIVAVEQLRADLQQSDP